MVAVAILIAGCGRPKPQLLEAKGRVEFEGQPLTAGAVTFHPDERNAYLDDKPSSLLETDGSFTMKTFPFGPGVPEGKYKVTLSDQLTGRIMRPDYSDVTKTPWEVEVTETGMTPSTLIVE